MAFYVIKAGESSFANADLMQAYTGMTFESMIQVYKASPMFGNIMFELSEDQYKDVLKNYHLVTVQNIDACLANFVKVEDRESGHADSEKLIKTDCKDKYEYGGFSFVPLKKLKMSGKYNYMKYLPAVKVCSSVFVALDTRFKEKKPYFFVVHKGSK